MAKRQIRVAGHRRITGPATEASNPALLRRSIGRPLRWVLGLILAAVATLVTSVLTGIPSQLFDVPAVQDELRSGADFLAAADIIYLDDQGRSMATHATEVDAQLQRLLTQPGAAATPEFLELVRAAGGVNVEKLTIRVVLEGRRNQQIRILGIHPVVLEQTPPLGGTLFDAPPQGGDPAMQMVIDLDHPAPVVREVLHEPGSGEPQAGRPFFANTTISLRDREQQVLVIRATATRHYTAFNLQIDYRLGDENKTMQISDHGQPFRITGLRTGPEPKTLTYERAFTLQDDFSLCPVTDPHRILTTPVPTCG
jgi:hypothetical protein